MFATGFALCLSACLDLGIVTVATIKRGLDSGARGDHDPGDHARPNARDRRRRE
jgi:hypothetical protein